MKQASNPLSRIAPNLNVPNLRKESTVRTTFRLDQKTVTRVESIASDWRTSLREVVDIAAMLPIEPFNSRGDAKDLDKEGSLLRKTYVMSASAVSALKRQSELLRLSRSGILSIQIEILHQALEERELVRTQNLPKAQHIVDELFRAAEAVERQLEELLPHDVEFHEELGRAIVYLMNLSHDISSEIEEDSK